MAIKNHYLLTIIALICTAINIAVYYSVYQSGNESQGFIIFSQFMIILWAAICVIMFSSALKSFGFGTTPGKAWFFLLLGLALWLIGDILYAYYAIAGLDPFPSIADYSFTFGYLFLFIGIIQEASLTKSKISSKELIIICTLTAVVLIIAAIYLLVPIATYPIDEEFTQAQMIFSLVYPVGDILLLPLTLLLYFKYRGGQFAKGWLLISIGFALAILFDLLFSYYEWMEVTTAYLVLDHFETGYYMVLGVGAVYFKELLKNF